MFYDPLMYLSVHTGSWFPRSPPSWRRALSAQLSACFEGGSSWTVQPQSLPVSFFFPRYIRPDPQQPSTVTITPPEPHNMEYSIRAANVEDCKDIARMIVVSGHAWRCSCVRLGRHLVAHCDSQATSVDHFMHTMLLFIAN